MALRTARTPRFTTQHRSSLRLAAALAGAAFCLPFPAAASDPKAIIQAAGLDGFLAADEPDAGPELDPAASKMKARKPAEFAGQDGVLALFDGRVVAGKVTPAPGGYLLKRPGATDEMIPTFLVQAASDSLTGCYESLRDSINPTRADDRLELANWCVRQRLLEEAKTEVLAALKLDPNRREARDLLVKLEEATSTKPRNRDSEPVPARGRDGFLDSTGRTTEGLSPEMTSQFVRRIQPLMVSKCGNAACHGGETGGEFRLANVRRTSSSGRSTTLENLRQVLAFVDSGEVERTRLLSALSSPAHVGVFSGPSASAQEAAIRTWVQGAAADKGMKPPEDQFAAGGSSVWTPETIALVSGKHNAAEEKSGEKKGAPARPDAPEGRRGAGLQKVKTPPQLRKAVDDAGLAETILKEERPDPFDPGEFNRMVQSRFGAGRSAAAGTDR